MRKYKLEERRLRAAERGDVALVTIIGRRSSV